MAKYYKLIDAMSESVTFYLPYQKNGGNVYRHFVLRPGVEYAEHIDDEVFVAALKDAHKRIAYTPEREEALKACGARYEVVHCKVCGGRSKKIDVWLVEVV